MKLLGDFSSHTVKIISHFIKVWFYKLLSLRISWVLLAWTGTSYAVLQVNSIDFQREHGANSILVVEFSTAEFVADAQRQGEALVITIPQATVPVHWQKQYDVADLSTPIEMVTVSQQGDDAQIRIQARSPYEYAIYQMNQKLWIKLSSYQPEAASGKRISLNFQNISVRVVLQLLAEVTGINIVASDSVQGSLTLRLQDIPWEQALDIILQTRGLAKRQMGNVMIVAPAAEIAAREREELQAKQQLTELEPLHSELISINYAKASEIASLLKERGNSLLSARGQVSVDVRTNTLWIQDLADRIDEIRDLIRQLDIPAQQVEIEARIVNIDKDYEKDLGVKLGISNRSSVSGTLQGANELRRGKKPEEVRLADRLNVNLPIKKEGVATVGLALARLGKGILLDLELAALETEGLIEIVSSPRLITANQREAFIEAGEEIPYQESTSSGAASIAFKKAVLRLGVVPQITPDGRIILTLRVNQDKRGKEVLGVPSIDTRKIETQVLTDNGETIVLGGIYERDAQNQVVKVPFLGDLPLLGRLFSRRLSYYRRKELIIFVTPRIIEQSTVNYAHY